MIPCVEGLLPKPFDDIVLTLVWLCAFWHAMAKLQIHTETTVDILEDCTRTLGKATRKFASACEELDTRELPNEEAARGRREVNVAANQKSSKGKQRLRKKNTQSGAKKKTLNLSTFKYHSLGHYPMAIRQCGTIDNYSTQVVRIVT